MIQLLAALACLAHQPPIAAQLPTPARVGFHHCVIIYDNPSRTAADLAPYVARTSARPGRPEWLFDAYLFCHFSTPAGIPTDGGATRMADWQYQLDRWFSPGRDLAGLEAAVAQAARRGAPPSKRKVIFTIPYLNRTVHDFGDVDGDGKGEDLATEAGRDAVLRWYTRQAMRRFAEARFRWLDNWGFYWMGEQIPEIDEPAARQATAVVHSLGKRITWIPWFRAPGFDRWRQIGFDMAFLQPNYAFQSWTHNGRVRRDRLAYNTDLARAAGMGVEMEAGAIDTSVRDRHAFLGYLEDGTPGRLGYQPSALCYYLSDRTVEEISRSRDPQVRALYERLADFIVGRPIVDPDPPVTKAIRTVGNRLELVAGFRRPRPVTELDVLLDGPADARRWSGLAEVQVRSTSTGPWLPGGWAVRPAPAAGGGSRGVVTVPVQAIVQQVRVVLTGAPGVAPPDPAHLRLDLQADTDTLQHLARGVRYTAEPSVTAAYPDNGRLLTDGEVPVEGWGRGRTVGWSGMGVRAAVTVDLGAEVQLDRVELHAVGGGSGGVSAPGQVLAILGTGDHPPAPGRGAGAPPAGLLWSACGAPVVERRRSDVDYDCCFAAGFPQGARARYVTFVTEGGYWTMLSEVRALRNGDNLARGAAYTLAPPPTAGGNGASAGDDLRYADDGARLVDGVVCRGFSAQQLTGWYDRKERQFTIDLGATHSVKRVVAWSLRGGQMDIWQPAATSVETSVDGKDWSAPAALAAEPGDEDGKSLSVARFNGSLDGSAVRYIRLRVRPGKGWAMLSEIEVR